MRPVGALLQRGFDNTVANWPLILIQVAGQIAMIVLFLVLFAVTVIPAVMIAGLTFDWNAIGTDPEGFFSGFILEHPFFVLYVLLAVGIVLLPIFMLVSFLEAGKFGTYVDGERARGESPSREPMRVFDPARWFRWGRERWWPIFWIYNILWGVAMLIVLAVIIAAVVVIAALAAAAGDAAAGVAVAFGCLSALMMLALFVVVMIVTAALTSLAMTIQIRDGSGAVESVRRALRFVRTHPIPVILIAIATIVVSVALGGAFSVFSLLFEMGSEMNSSVLLILVPMQIGIALIQGLISAAVQAWTSATFASAVMSEDRVEPLLQR